ncbi:baculoviral IAP repeat-containing protein 3-like [Saccostrea echinata]|uniref:baculoviral IAP repeat-containing protein 3-like n=1 Tax=Saccostrea echinata TaxID=191078 RepID=UPI002A824719|nr:baculoviral IAP repeat-containing protein 3-like [Saccostrea echinata]
MALYHSPDPKSNAHKTDTSRQSQQRGADSRETNSSGISSKTSHGQFERVSRNSTSASSTETSQRDDQESSNDPDKKFVKEHHSTETSDYHSIQCEVQKLQDLTLCKVCMDANVNIVFMPCGHIVTCFTCSKSVKKCPLCRQKIKGTVKAYLS